MKKVLIILLGLLVLAGCAGNENDDGCSVGYEFKDGECVLEIAEQGVFASSTDIMDVFETFSEKVVFFGVRFTATDDVAMAQEGDLNNKTSDEAGSDDYSETNNQVDGVDEMDNVLTDGKYIYVNNHGKIQIILSYTQESGTDVLSLVKEIEFDHLEEESARFYPSGMYVDDERLIVIGTTNYYTCSTEAEEKENDGDTSDIYPGGDLEDYYYECRYYEYHTMTHVFEYSIGEFDLVDEYQLSGYLIGSRKIGDSIYFVTNEYIPYYLDRYEEVDFSIDNYLPSYYVNDIKTSLTYGEILYVEGTEPTNFTTFYGINLDSNDVSTEVVLGEGGYNLYVSTENMYLSNTKWTWNEDVLITIEEAINSGDDLESDLEEDPYEIATSIIKIIIADGVVEFSTNGEVPGMGLDQFAMDEQDGYLRIVTTTRNWWWWGQESDINNRLMVLDSDLNIVATLENLGKPGESVQSTRFVGDYAYVVTFLNTDPFYVIDLSDPLNPSIESELVIPGFSDYLQPISEDFILGIGYGDNDGGTSGLKISLYDVSDKQNAVVASEIIYSYENNSYMWTSTLYNHKDLLVSIGKGIIALPYTLNDYSGDDYRWSYHTGILVLNLDVLNGTISERAMVEHSENDYYDTYIYKSKFISDYIYTISSKYVKVSTIADPETILNSVLIGESRQMETPYEVDPSTDSSTE